MRSAAPALLPVFRSQLQADILAALLLNPGREYSMTELAQRFGAPLSTVHGEVKRLTEAGLLRRRNIGRSAMVQANPGNRLVEPLAELLLLSWGPLQVIADEFAGLDRAERVLIFGSWAARYRDPAGGGVARRRRSSRTADPVRPHRDGPGARRRHRRGASADGEGRRWLGGDEAKPQWSSSSAAGNWSM